MARIYPVYLLTLLISVLIYFLFNRAIFSAAHIDETVARFFWQFFLLAALPVRSLIGFWDIPAWSVSVEAFCYALLFPSIFLASRRVAAGPALLLSMAIIVLSAADFLTFVTAYRSNILGIGYGDAPLALSYWVPMIRGMSMFVAGWLGYLLLIFRPRLGVAAGRCVDITALAFAALVVATSHGFGQRHLVVFLAPALIAGLMNPRALTSRLLSSSVFVFLGRISYSLYLVHIPILIAYHVSPLFRTGNALDFYAPFTISVGFAALSYGCFEVPSRRLIRCWLGRSINACPINPCPINP